MRICTRALAVLAVAAILLPARADEFLLDTCIVYAPSVGGQSKPALACDGTNYLMVWEDHRSVTTFDIYGTRFGPDGAVLDPGGIPISLAADGQYDPSVAFDGANYLVVWEDTRGTTSDIYCCRVSTGGIVLDTAGVPVSTATYHQQKPAIAFAGTHYLIVWEDYRNSSGSPDVYGARVRTDGVVLDTAGIPISVRSGEDQATPALAFDGANCLIVWSDARNGFDDIYGSRVSASGAVLDTAGLAISAADLTQQTPAIAFDGSNYVVTWADLRNYPPAQFDIYAARVTPAGAVLDTSGIEVSRASDHQLLPAIAHGPAGTLAVWADKRNDSMSYSIYCARVGPAGQVLDTAGIRISPAGQAAYYPAVAAGDNFLLFWSMGYVLGARVTPSGSVLDTAGIPVAVSANHQSEPAVASDGSDYLAVWQDYRGIEPGFDIYGARTTAGARVLDPAPIAISGAARDQLSPSVAAGSSQYLITWQDARSDSNDLFCARVSAAGAVLDPAGVPVSAQSGEQRLPAGAYDGTNYLVAWEDNRNGTDFNVYAARVSPAGAVLDPNGIALTSGSGDQLLPSVAFGNSCYLVAWEDATGGMLDIYGARVSPQGQVLDSAPLLISANSYGQSYPSVAFGADHFLVVWMDIRNGTDYDVYASRVSLDGTVLDPDGIAVSAVTGGQLCPAVAFDGADFVVVWEDDRQSYENYDIYGAKVSPEGVVADTIVVTMQPDNQRTPAIAHGPESQVLVAYSGWTGQINGRPAQTMRAWGKLYPAPGIEETPTAKVRTTNGATIVRGVLRLPEARIERRESRGELLDVSGRGVLSLKPGPNDVSRLSPGVYFVTEQSAFSNQHSGPTAAGGERSAVSVRKVVIQR